MTVEIKILGNTSSLATDIRKRLADVVKAVSVDLTWGGLAEDTMIIEINALHPSSCPHPYPP